MSGKASSASTGCDLLPDDDDDDDDGQAADGADVVGNAPVISATGALLPGPVTAAALENPAVNVARAKFSDSEVDTFAAKQFSVSNFSNLNQYEHMQQMVDMHQGTSNEFQKLERSHPTITAAWKDQQKGQLRLIDEHLTSKALPRPVVEACLEGLTVLSDEEGEDDSGAIAKSAGTAAANHGLIKISERRSVNDERAVGGDSRQEMTTWTFGEDDKDLPLLDAAADEKVFPIGYGLGVCRKNSVPVKEQLKVIRAFFPAVVESLHRRRHALRVAKRRSIHRGPAADAPSERRQRERSESTSSAASSGSASSRSDDEKRSSEGDPDHHRRSQSQRRRRSSPPAAGRRRTMRSISRSPRRRRSQSPPASARRRRRYSSAGQDDLPLETYRPRRAEDRNGGQSEARVGHRGDCSSGLSERKRQYSDESGRSESGSRWRRRNSRSRSSSLRRRITSRRSGGEQSKRWSAFGDDRARRRSPSLDSTGRRSRRRLS